MSRYSLCILLIFFSQSFIGCLYAQENGSAVSLTNLSWEELMNIQIVVTPSQKSEKLLEAPGTIVVITHEDIVNRGYSSLDEILYDIQGFDLSFINGSHYINAYQRGYRTPWTQRTLLMINGIVDNHLWSHVAAISRQYPLSNIKRIEILYGPASAIYGPNAFLGIINIITEDGSELTQNGNKVKVNLQYGSYNSRSIEFSTSGKYNKFHYSLSTRFFQSDEPDLSDKWGFLSNDLYGSKSIWGPILDIEQNGRKLGEYYDPTDDHGIFGSFSHGDLKFGFIWWSRNEGYGATYVADRAQNNSFWNLESRHFYIHHKKDISKNLNIETLVKYRKSDILNGPWAEAYPDSKVGKEDSSYISFTYWNSLNNSFLYKENVLWNLSKNITVSGGIKYEIKELTKAYDIPGYWQPAFSSTTPAGTGIGYSGDSTYIIPHLPRSTMPSSNLILTNDLGGYVQNTVNYKKFRFNLGLRYDVNSISGKSINPRLAGIYTFSKKGAFKLFYGEAFQEPSQRQLWGGWSGRLANPDLMPEKVRNLETVILYSSSLLLEVNHGLSVYFARYENVIKEEAENAGEREVFGIEYSANFRFKNFLPNSNKIIGYLNYSFTDSKSSILFDHTNKVWKDGEATLGDIAPHKINLGINLPIYKKVTLNTRANYVSTRQLYLRNALRAENRLLDGYILVNSNITYVITEYCRLAFKIRNLLNENYYHPGVQQADSGDDFTKRSLGFRNSLVPQPGRSFWVTLSFIY